LPLCFQAGDQNFFVKEITWVFPESDNFENFSAVEKNPRLIVKTTLTKSGEHETR
jgi:hypothetical protein